MAFLGKPDFQHSLQFENQHLYAPYQGSGAHTLLPSGMSLTRDDRNRPEFHLDIYRGPSPQLPPEPYGVLRMGLQPRFQTEESLSRLRADQPEATIQEAPIHSSYIRLQPGDLPESESAFRLSPEDRRPRFQPWNHSGVSRVMIRLSQHSAVALEKTLEREAMTFDVLVEAELWGVSPRLSVAVEFEPGALIGRCQSLGVDGIISRQDLKEHFLSGIMAGGEDLPLRIEGSLEESMYGSFVRALDDRIRERFGEFVPSPEGQGGGYMRLESEPGDKTGRIRWDFSVPILVPRVVDFSLDPLRVARELVREEGIESLVTRTTVPPLTTGIHPLMIEANLPVPREGALLTGVSIEAEPNPPRRMQAIRKSVTLRPPGDHSELQLRFSPEEEPRFEYRTFVVVRDAGGIERLQGPVHTSSSHHLLLTTDDFPLTFVQLDASRELLARARLDIECTWTMDDQNLSMTTTLGEGRSRTAVALPETALDPTLTLHLIDREGEGRLTLGPLSASGGTQRFGLYSFPEYGPHQITVTCEFDDDSTLLAIDLVPEAAAGSAESPTVFAFRPERPTRTWSWMARDPFQPGYRYRLHDRGDGTPGPWSEPRSPFEPLVVSTSEREELSNHAR